MSSAAGANIQTNTTAGRRRAVISGGRVLHTRRTKRTRVTAMKRDQHSFLELGVRAVRVVDELLVQGQGLLVHESLTAAIALHRGIKLQADVLDRSIAAARQRVVDRHCWYAEESACTRVLE